MLHFRGVQYLFHCSLAFLLAAYKIRSASCDALLRCSTCDLRFSIDTVLRWLTYCWCFRNPKANHRLDGDSNPVNHGINYRTWNCLSLKLVSRISESHQPNLKRKVVFLLFMMSWLEDQFGRSVVDLDVNLIVVQNSVEFMVCSTLNSMSSLQKPMVLCSWVLTAIKSSLIPHDCWL